MEVTFNKNESDINSSIITLQTPIPANTKPAVPLLLDRILNKGSRTKDYDTLYKEIHKAGININFETNMSSISVTAENLSEDNEKVLNLIKEVITQPRFNNECFEYAKKDLIESIKNTDNYADENAFKALFPNSPEFATKDEVLKSIEETSLADIVGFHEYIKKHAVATATISAPIEKNPNIENNVLQNLSKNFLNFQPFQKKIFNNYQELKENVVVKKVEPKSQADIVKAFKFKTNYNPKDQLTFKLLNTILGESSSSRLFSDLRETQKLAYHVSSDLAYFGNTGVISLGIQTTTDDKMANVQSFENVNKSLAGFDKHIEKLKNELVTDEELKAAKLKIKTRMMNSLESSASKTNILNSSKHSIQGINQINENMKLIDTITAEDIQNAAKYIFSTPSVTSILASEDTINYLNK
jgi:predicted Zn-dependent peptidase